ncbi:unnamed protein product, partial [Mesorhabditis belari]|uniref:Uncharacterized protein n=1 Tax=Mesorhabditis belari TaxID=2138241 RepID=A0AAF3J5P2_9BILA
MFIGFLFAADRDEASDDDLLCDDFEKDPKGGLKCYPIDRERISSGIYCCDRLPSIKSLPDKTMSVVWSIAGTANHPKYCHNTTNNTTNTTNTTNKPVNIFRLRKIGNNITPSTLKRPTPMVHNLAALKTTTTTPENARPASFFLKPMSILRLMHQHLHSTVKPNLEETDFKLPDDFLVKKMDTEMKEMKPTPMIVPLASMRRPDGHVFGVKGIVAPRRASTDVYRQKVQNVKQEITSTDEATTLERIRSAKGKILAMDAKIDQFSLMLKTTIKDEAKPSNILSRQFEQMSPPRKKPSPFYRTPPPNTVQCQNCGNQVAKVELVYHKAKCSEKNLRLLSHRPCPSCGRIFVKEADFLQHVHECDRGFYKDGKYVGKWQLKRASVPVIRQVVDQKNVEEVEDPLTSISVTELISKFRQDALNALQQPDRPLLYPDQLPLPDEQNEMRCVVTKCTGMLKPRAERNKADLGKRWRCNSCGRFYRYVRAGDEKLIMAAEWASRRATLAATASSSAVSSPSSASSTATPPVVKKPIISQINYRKAPPPFVRLTRTVKLEEKEEINDRAPLLMPEMETKMNVEEVEVRKEKEEDDDTDVDEEVDSEEEELREVQMQLRNMSRQQSLARSCQPSPLSLQQSQPASPLPIQRDSRSPTLIASSGTASPVPIAIVGGDGKRMKIEEDDSCYVSVEELIRKENEEAAHLSVSSSNGFIE